MTPTQIRTCLLALAVSLTAGCYVYRQEVRQGNFISDSALEQLAVGMTRSQVEFLLGRPMVADPFHHDRWDYVFFLDIKDQPLTERRLVVLFEGDTVSEIRR